MFHFRFYLFLHMWDEWESFDRHSKRFIRRNLSGKRESYFAAIGGDSDEPPPDLNKEQVCVGFKIELIAH